MSRMLSVASGFQYSVNIGYDLNSEEKLKNFIPTQSALSLLEEVLLSTSPNSTERSRILIGAYGKGKSHIVLMILSMLMKKDIQLFGKTISKIKENPKLYQSVQNYYDSSNRILPVVITGSNTSLTQAFLLALKRTLSDNNLLDVMPDTNYQAAISVIERWQNEFPSTYEQLKKTIGMPVNAFIDKLRNYDITAYEQFERVYPALTAGSTFNPFLGFDVVELYESVAKNIRCKGFSGLFIVYDEFSKYLEANITEASVSDTKMLQDLAEKCNRSGDTQLHLMLISHKEISNYIDKLPKRKVDGWRGVSERFKHIHMSNNFSQTYEIIGTVIQKDKTLWEQFCTNHSADFLSLFSQYQAHSLFAGNLSELNTAIYDCYPLHPVSTFILPRLSERVAQNERTLFTFLSSEGGSTLSAFLEKYQDDTLSFITPDIIYDYFEPLFRKEVYAGELYENYRLTTIITARLSSESLEAKIVKTISLTYALTQFERLKPTKDEIIGIYSSIYSTEEILNAIDTLIEQELVVYLKRSNGYLKLKQSSGVDIWQKIHNQMEVIACKKTTKEIINSANFEDYMYPSRYNDEREMVRFFSVVFIDEDEVKPSTNWEIKSEDISSDGVVFAVIPHSQDSIRMLRESLLESSRGCGRHIFILPQKYKDIDKYAQEFDAVAQLRSSAEGDDVLFNEYDVVYDDLNEVINGFLMSYTHPEKFESDYIFNGEVRMIHRKAALTELLSDICDDVFSMTPSISNEAVNRQDITSIAKNSRQKIVAALLRNQLEHNLGLTGTGQEVSIMRSTLIRTGIWSEEDGIGHVLLTPDDRYVANVLQTIVGFINKARQESKVGFEEVYSLLTSPQNHIGLRKGLIPIFMAVVLHEYRQQVLISDSHGQVPLSADVLLQINSNPEMFSLSYIDWNPEKEDFIANLSILFKPYIVEAEQGVNTYDFIVNAMRRWMMALPKCTREIKAHPSGDTIDHRYASYMRLLRQNNDSYDLLFVKLPKAFGYEGQFTAGLAENIGAAKKCYDNIIGEIREDLIERTKQEFLLKSNLAHAKRMSLASVIMDWCDSLDQDVFDYLFQDGTEKCLGLFRTVTQDAETFIARLAKTVTGLRIEDWGQDTRSIYFARLRQYKKSAESYKSKTNMDGVPIPSGYQITFVDSDGKAITKTFDKMEKSKRGQLLYNQIEKALDAMGHAISEQEKRQILIDVLQNLC